MPSRDEPPFPWHRLILGLSGILVMLLVWRWATFHLYALPVTSLTAFQAITVNMMYVVAAIVIFMVTGKLIYDWKNTTSTQIITQAQTLFSKETESIDPQFQTPELQERYADQ